MFLTIKTDNPESEIGLYDEDMIDYKKWLSDRKLSEQLLNEILKLLEKNHQTPEKLEGIVVFKGPGSFTGLRIGASVANAFSYSVGCQIVGAKGANWAKDGISRIKKNQNDKIVVPEYGAEANITKPKK